jgi:hypothetical protein
MEGLSAMTTEWGNLQNYKGAEGFAEFTNKWFGGEKDAAIGTLANLDAYASSKGMGEMNKVMKEADQDPTGAGYTIGRAVGIRGITEIGATEKIEQDADRGGRDLLTHAEAMAGASPLAYSSSEFGFHAQVKDFTDGHGNVTMRSVTGAVPADKGQREALAHMFKSGGYGTAARGVMQDKHGAAFSMTLDSHGKVVAGKAETGVSSSHTDLVKTDKGSQSQVGTFGQYGARIVHSDVNVNEVGHGNVLMNPQTTLQMAMNGDPAGLFGAGDARAHGLALETSISHVSSQTAQALAPIISQKGENANQLIISAAAKAGISTPVGGMNAGFEASGISKEVWAYNRIQNMDAAVISNARTEATSQRLTGDQFTQHVANRHSIFVNEMAKIAGDKQEFGIQKPAGVVREVGEGVFGKSGGGDSFPNFGYGP